MIGELPLAELSSLVRYAEETERERVTRSVYLEYFNAMLSVGHEPMGYPEYLAKVTESNAPQTKLRDSSDILTDMQKIEELYRTKGGSNG